MVIFLLFWLTVSNIISQNRTDSKINGSLGEDDEDLVPEKTSGYLFLLYRNGMGTDKKLRELGLLGKVKSAVENNTKLTGNQGTISERFIKQLIEGRGVEFKNTYNFLSVKFAIGSATVSGRFSGQISKSSDGTTHIDGTITYTFFDDFTDPYDIFNLIPGEWNPDGKPYIITDSWKKEVNGDY